MPKKPTAAKAAPSKTAKAAPSAPIVLTTPIAEFIVLSEADRQVRFAEKAQVNRVSFSEMGKLHYLISEDIAAWNAAHPTKKERTIYGELRKLAVSDKAISNASYASRVWRELLAPDHITEAQFDSLTFQDCFAIMRSMSSRSAIVLDAAAVAELIEKQPLDFDDELRSIYEHGVTVAEKKAQDAKADADRVQALVAAQKPAPTPAVEPAAAPTPAVTTEPVTGEAAPVAAPTANEAPAATGETGADETPAAETPQAEPTNITNLPPQEDPDRNLAAMIDVLAEIEKESETFSFAGQQALLAKIDEARAVIAARVEAAAAA